MNKVLITLPNHDKVTAYLFAWSKEITKEKYQIEYKFLELEGKEANREKVESYLKKQNPKLVLFNGHGSDNFICGFKDNILIQSEVNDNLLKGKIVYALSCRSANILGKTAVKKGTDSFIGYEDDFVIVTDSEREATPLKDNIASSFLKPSNRLVISLLKGKTARESLDKSKEEFKKEIKKYLSSSYEEGTEQIISYLLWDMDNQVVLGNNEAKLI